MTSYVNIPAIAQAAHPVVQIENGQAITLSTEVARVFDKQHKNVLQSIENLISDVGTDHRLNFQQTVITRPNPSGGEPIKSPAYHLTRDGFTLLAFGFTGKRALAFKLAYIDAFNQMEAQLTGNAPAPAPQQLEIPMAQTLGNSGITQDMIADIVASTTQNLVTTLQQKRKLIHWPEVIEALQNPKTEMQFHDLTGIAHACLARLQRNIDAEAYGAIQRRASNRNQTTADVALNA